MVVKRSANDTKANAIAACKFKKYLKRPKKNFFFKNKAPIFVYKKWRDL